ncbi:MAG: sugar-binding protein, partial [Gemmatimonadales bacterium]
MTQVDRRPAVQVAVAPFLTVELELDGELSEWENVPGIPLDSSSYLLTDTVLYDGNADLSGAIQFVWDTTYLYIAGRFADDRLAAGAAWTSDRVNLVFDLHNDNHPLSYGGEAPDASRWQPDDQWVYAHIVGDGKSPYPIMRLGHDYHGPLDGAQLASRSVEGGWTFEMQVAWAGLAESRPFVGAVFGMQIFVSDGDGVGRLT